MRVPYIESKIEYTFIEKLHLRFQTVFIILCGKARKNLSVQWSINFHIENAIIPIDTVARQNQCDFMFTIFFRIIFARF